MSYYRPRQRDDRKHYQEQDRLYQREEQEFQEVQEQEEEDGVKPYTAVGAMLDSATRFKRRMNYGRVPQKR